MLFRSGDPGPAQPLEHGPAESGDPQGLAPKCPVADHVMRARLADIEQRQAIDGNSRLRQIQAQRFASLGKPELRTNAEADGALLEDIAKPDAAGLTLLRDAADAMKLSARGYHRVLRVARTLADLEQREQVARIHIAEALSYRQKPAAFTAAA